MNNSFVSTLFSVSSLSAYSNFSFSIFVFGAFCMSLCTFIVAPVIK